MNLWPITAACSVKQFIAFFDRHEVPRCPCLFKYKLFNVWNLWGLHVWYAWMCTQHREKGTLKFAVEWVVLIFVASHEAYRVLFLQKLCTLCQERRALLKVLSFAAWLRVTWKLYSHVHLNILRPRYLRPHSGQELPTDYARLDVVATSRGRPLLTTMGRSTWVGHDVEPVTKWIQYSSGYKRLGHQLNRSVTHSA